VLSSVRAGKGEYFVRSVCAYDVSARMLYGNASLQQAAHDTVHNGVRRTVVPEGEQPAYQYACVRTV
jgi:isoaspartyl peptidase/L-asparaginase-like protein (Ntn-hydrolase superfamily)